MKKSLQENIDVSQLSNFKTKAKTRYYFEINTLDDVFELKSLYDFASENNLKIIIIGAGTNTMFAFYEFDGIIIKNNLRGFEYDKNSKILKIYACEPIWEISEKLMKDYDNDLWYRFIGLPGSIGGAVYGNAGCFGLETENNFLSCEVYNITNSKIEILDKNQMNFSYRSSILKETGKYFIISATFDLSKKVEKYENTQDVIKFRNEVQPAGNCCGSFFKNPSKEFSAGKLIEEVGLKGYHYNNAYFSEKHANFLMMENDNGDYQDLIFLINLAQEKVKNQFNIDIIPEVRIITN